jgi:hypothetical protein
MLGVVLVCSGLLGADPLPPDSPRNDELETYRAVASRAGRDPEVHVRLALWCEAHGLKAERLKHLALAVLADPAHPAARGLMGLVADGDKWRRPEQVADRVKADAELAAKLADYNARRARTPMTAEAQWKLALWCEQQGLKPEATAHLTAVTRLDPRRAEAWKKLGFSRHNGRWTTDEQRAAARAEAAAQAKADRHWRPTLAQWKADLHDPAKRAAAESALAGVTDPRAVPAVCKVFGLGPEADQARGVQLLGQIESPAASRALAALAVFGKSAEVRRVATETLRRRDGREFTDMLIGLVRKPIQFEVKPVGGPGSPGVLFVEGEQYNVRRIYAAPTPPNLPRLFNNSVPFDPDNPGSYAAAPGVVQQASLEVAAERNNAVVPVPPGNRPGNDLAERAIRRDMEIANNFREAQRAAMASEQRLINDVAALQAMNAEIVQGNDRVLPILSAVTGKDLGTDREAWKTWWADEQGYSYTPSTSPKPTLDQAAPSYQPTFVTGVPVTLHHSCFAAGTPVRTLDGPRPIESLRVGDRLLTQDMARGGLSYQPIVAVYHNRPAATLRINLGGETIVATPIHRFWRAGRGWTMARDLKLGDAIRTVGGLSRVVAVEEDRVQPVFNLEVARNQSYFVGRDGALVHDNSLVQPASAPFDAEPTLAAGEIGDTR